MQILHGLGHVSSYPRKWRDSLALPGCFHGTHLRAGDHRSWRGRDKVLKKPGVTGIQLCAIALSAWSNIRSAWGRQSRVVSIKSGVMRSSLCLPFLSVRMGPKGSEFLPCPLSLSPSCPLKDPVDPGWVSRLIRLMILPVDRVWEV